jgi:hypothetical protein
VGAQRVHGVERKPRRRAPRPGKRAPEDHGLLLLQRSAGNAAVAQALSVQRAPAKDDDDLGGIGARFAVDQYAGVAKRLQGVWGRLTPYSRANGFLIAANFELAHIDVPSVELKMEKLDGNDAEFKSDGWRMLVNPPAFADDHGADEQVAESASTIYHEARHAEQAFLVARLLAGKGLDVDEIAQTFPIRDDIAARAKQQPLKKAGRERKLASRVLASETGAGATYNASLMHDLNEIEKKLDAAETAWKALPSGPAKDKAKEKVDFEQAAYEIAYRQYREQAHEADAWKVGDAVRGRLAPPKPVP